MRSRKMETLPSIFKNLQYSKHEQGKVRKHQSEDHLFSSYKTFPLVKFYL